MIRVRVLPKARMNSRYRQAANPRGRPAGRTICDQNVAAHDARPLPAPNVARRNSAGRSNASFRALLAIARRASLRPYYLRRVTMLRDLNGRAWTGARRELAPLRVRPRRPCCRATSLRSSGPLRLARA